MLEIEYKYLCDRWLGHKRVSNDLRQTFLDAGLTVSDSTTRSRVDIYLDTTTRELSKLNWSLRLRRPKSHQPSLELKRLCTNTGIFRREEITQPWTSEGLAQSCGPVTKKLRRLLGSLDTLHPLADLHIKRTSIILTHPDYPDSTVACEIDLVKTEDCRYVEIELELRDGKESLLHMLDYLIQQDCRIFPARLSKFHRAMNTNTTVEHSSFVPTSWSALAHHVLRREMNALIEAEPRAWESINEDGVHDLRVSTRRMRAHLDLFAQMYDHNQVERIHKHLGKLGHVLGAVRDDDVHLTQVEGHKPAQIKYRKSVLRRHAKHSRVLRQLLAEIFATSIKAIEQLVEQPPNTSPNPWSRLNRNVEGIRDFKIQQNPSPKQLHKLRKSVKVVTYQLQAIALVDPNLAKLYGSAKHLQQLLGEFQDREMGQARLSQYRKKTAVNLHFKIDHPSTYTQALSSAWAEFTTQLSLSRAAEFCSKT